MARRKPATAGDDTPWCTTHDVAAVDCQGRDHGPASLKVKADTRRRKAVASWPAPKRDRRGR